MPDDTPASRPERHVFVYGTLRRGGSNDITRLQPAPRFVGMAQVPGALYTLGAYPGLRLDGHGPQDVCVVGEVYAITPALEVVLDAIEGVEAQARDEDEYAKRDIDVVVNGQTLRCLMYEIHPRHAVVPARLHHGDWFQCAPCDGPGAAAAALPHDDPKG